MISRDKKYQRSLYRAKKVISTAGVVLVESKAPKSHVKLLFIILVIFYFFSPYTRYSVAFKGLRR